MNPFATLNDVANARQIQQLLDNGAHFFCGHSGGKDSETMYRLLNDIVPSNRLHVIHADLGDIEWAGVKEYIHSVIKHPLLIAKAIHADGSPKDLFSAIRQRRETLDATDRHDAPAFPSSAARFCTSDLKTGPIWKVIRQIAKNVNANIVVNCVGIRGDESPARQKKIDQRGTLNVNAKNTTQSRSAYDWWPIANWTTPQVWDFLHANGSAGHPAYADGNDRLSCMFCIFGSTGDLQHAHRANPDLYQRYIDLEIEVRTTMFNGKSLADRVA
jgi:DNA sulfur modification protein DndC